MPFLLAKDKMDKTSVSGTGEVKAWQPKEPTAPLGYFQPDSFPSSRQ